jgi:hypothetical protein
MNLFSEYGIVFSTLHEPPASAPPYGITQKTMVRALCDRMA